jgi:hypothetical protein
MNTFGLVLVLLLAAGGGRQLLAAESVAIGNPTDRTLEYVPHFANTNHPELCYWFVSPGELSGEKYISTLDKLADQGLYTLIFLTARERADFYDTEKMRPIFQKLVAHAHQRGLKIGLQLWASTKPVALEHTERAIVEGEATLDENGAATYSAKARGVRNSQPFKSDLLKAYAFVRTAEGFYDLATLTDITAQCRVSTPDKATVQVEIQGSPELRGRTVYLMTQHYYNYASNHDPEAAERFLQAIRAYRDIPFDGVALDEYTNLRIPPPWELKKLGGVFRERFYSLAMAKKYQATTGQPLERALFDMRYAPAGQPEVTMRAINNYMALMRQGTLNVERAVYRAAKEIYGPNTFAGVHATHHNALTADEIWVTGINWWTIPREYGQTDEHTPLPTQMGVAFAYPTNALFNMYYNKSLDDIVAKALGDLRHGIRTHYHAVNDVQGWGVDLAKPEVFAGINPVERCARLLNRFNPSLPDVKLLVVFGTEALANWYPDAASRGAYDINDKLATEEKARALWEAGYLNALVPSDLIESGQLRLNAAGQPTLNGRTFDAVVYLNPQYARESALNFLERYVVGGGKLMLEGEVTRDFSATDIAARFGKISRQAVAKKISVEEISKLGVVKKRLPDGCRNADGSYVFTDVPSLTNAQSASFTVRLGTNLFAGDYHGLAAIAADTAGRLTKFTAAGFTALRCNGQVVFSFDQPTDVFLVRHNGNLQIVVADERKAIKPQINQLDNQP